MLLILRAFKLFLIDISYKKQRDGRSWQNSMMRMQTEQFCEYLPNNSIECALFSVTYGVTHASLSASHQLLERFWLRRFLSSTVFGVQGTLAIVLPHLRFCSRGIFTCFSATFASSNCEMVGLLNWPKHYNLVGSIHELLLSSSLIKYVSKRTQFVIMALCSVTAIVVNNLVTAGIFAALCIKLQECKIRFDDAIVNSVLRGVARVALSGSLWRFGPLFAFFNISLSVGAWTVSLVPTYISICILPLAKSFEV